MIPEKKNYQDRSRYTIVAEKWGDYYEFKNK